MKILKNNFDNYTNSFIKIHNLKELDKLNETNYFKNLIIFGREGIGKYTEAINFIKKLSPSQLKYEKKIAINNSNNKNDIFIKISDIHYEIDFELLGFNSKSLFNEIYNLIIEIICTKTKKEGIILCKNFELVDSELLDLFYSYIKNDENKIFKIKFILLMTNYSFLPNSIIDICQIISLKVPAKYNVKKIGKSKAIINYDNDINYIKNFKDIIYLKHVEYNKDYIYNIYNKIINNNIDFNTLRNELYDLLIYRVKISNFIWELLELLIKNNKIKENKINNCLDKTFNFFIYYNNNYRPIFHLESYIIYLIKIVNEY